ncbi:MAG TPA: PAS domain S-box protein [Paludibacter sp.]|nr:PAS domain S-box protein [Paludibacter sp.]
MKNETDSFAARLHCKTEQILLAKERGAMSQFTEADLIQLLHEFDACVSELEARNEKLSRVCSQSAELLGLQKLPYPELGEIIRELREIEAEAGIPDISDNQQCVVSTSDMDEWKEIGKFKEAKHEILQVLNEHAEIKWIAWQVVETLKGMVGFDAVGIRLGEDDGSPYLAQDGFPGEPMPDDIDMLYGLVLGGQKKPGRQLSDGGSWWTNDFGYMVEKTPDGDFPCSLQSLCIERGYSSLAIIPLRNNEKVFGMIQLAHRRKHGFGIRAVELLEDIASYISMAMMRVEAEDRLRKNEYLLRSITENAPDIIMQLDRDGIVLYANRGVDGADGRIVGEHFNLVISPRNHQLVNDALQRVFEESVVRTFDTQEMNRNGETRWYRTSISPLFVDKRVDKAVLIARDITDSLNAEKTIKKDMNRHHSIIHTAMDGFWMVDIHGNLIEVNDSYARMSGYSVDELMAMRIPDLDNEFSENELLNRLQGIKNEEQEFRFESQHRKKNGELWPVEISVQYQPDYDQFVVFLRDITERKHDEGMLNYQAGLIENVSDAIISTDKDFNIVSWNKSAEAIYGWKQEDVIGRQTIDVLFTEYVGNLSREEVLSQLEESGLWKGEVIQRRKDNSPVDILSSAKLLRDEAGEVIGSVAVNHDITEMKKSETVLRQTEERYKTVFRDNISVVLLVDPDSGLMVDVNQAASDYYGWRHEELCAKNINQIMAQPPTEVSAVLAGLKEKQSHGLYRHKLATGEVRDVEMFSGPVRFGNSTYVYLQVQDVTERLRADEALKEKDMLLSNAQAIAHLGSWSLDLRIDKLTWSDEMYRIFGQIPGEFKGTYGAFLETIHPDDHEKVNTAYTSSIEESRDEYEVEHRVVRKTTGEIRHVVEKCQHVRDEAGRIVMSIGMTHDITERKQAEEQLRKSEERYKSMFELNKSVMMIIDPDTGRIVDVNPSACQYYGWSHDEICRKHIWDINLLSKEEVLDEMRKAQEEKRYHFICRHWLANNEIRDVEVYSGLIEFDEKEYLYSIVHDISERCQIEEDLKQSEERYKSLFENSMTMMMLINPDTADITAANPAACRFYGWSHEELCRKSLTEISPIPKVEIILHLQKTKQKKQNHLFLKHQLANGELRDVEVFSSPVYFGESVLIHAIINDVTERTRISKELQENKDNLRAILDATQESIMLYDCNGMILEANQTATKRFGRKGSDMVGHYLKEFLSASLYESRFSHMEKVVKTGKPVQFIDERDRFILENTFFPVFSNGKVVAVANFSRDITKLKRAEKAIVDSEKKLRNLVNDMQVGVILYEHKTGKLLSNPRVLELLGITEKQLQGHSAFSPGWYAIYEDGSMFPGNGFDLAKMGTGNMPEEFVIGVFKPQANDWAWLMVNVISRFTEGGDVAQVFYSFMDITMLKKAQTQLKESEFRFRKLIYNVEVGITLVNSGGEVVLTNPKGLELLGLKEDEIVGRYTVNIPVNQIHEDGRFYEYGERPAQKALETGKPVRDVVMGICHPGKKDLTWLLVNAEPIFDESGLLTEVISSYMDITRLMETEKALVKSEEKFSLIYKKSPYAIVLWQWPDGKVENVNEAFDVVFGIPGRQIVGRKIQKLGLIQSQALWGIIRSELRENGFIHDIEENYVAASGETRILRYDVDTVELSDNKYVVLTAEDITTRRRNEDALREREYFFRESQHAAFIGSYKTDFVAGVWESSEVLDDIFGIDDSYEKSIENWLAIAHPDDRDMLSHFIENEVVRSGQPFDREYRIRRVNDGETRWVHGLGKVSFDESHRIISLVGTIQDITERKVREEALRRLNQTLAALNKSRHLISQQLDESEYLKQVCKIVVEDTDFAMVWIGFVDEETNHIHPVASAGFKNDYLKTLRIIRDDSEYGRGPTAVAARTGEMSVCNDMTTDRNFEPWREQALKNGFRSSVAFPLKKGDEVFGTISIYSKEKNALLDVELNLLSELASDLVQGIATIRLRVSHQLAEEALNKSYAELEILVKERTRELRITNEMLKKEINVRKQQEQNLKLTEEKYRTVADFAANWEFWNDPDDFLLYCSPSCERITGYMAKEFIENPKLIYNIIHPDDLEFYWKHVKSEMNATTCDHEIQFRIFRKDGAVRWLGHYCQPIFDEAGNFKGTRGSNKDISARKKMEAMLVTSNQKYKLLSENISDGIFICKNGQFEYVNKAVSVILGYKSRELEGMKLTQFVISDYSETLEGILYSNDYSNHSTQLEIECMKKDLTIISVEIFLNYVAEEKTVYGVIQDITERKQIQKNILKAIIETEENEKAHFSKELHDGLGPLLSTIKLYLQWSERSKSNESRLEIIHKAEEILEESLATVKEISNKLSPHLLTNYGLNSAVNSFIDKLQATSTVQINFESNLGHRLNPELEAALYRTIIECVNNTIKHASAKNVEIILHEENRKLSLTYKDDGVGFDVTQAISNKKGLGLFNLQNRIQTIGGRVSIASQPGEGVYYQFVINI